MASETKSAEQKRGGRRALAAPAALLGLLALAAVFLSTRLSPTIVPTRVLVDGAEDAGELRATIEAEYREAASWHSTGFEGGSCSVVAPCGGRSCQVLRAAVLRPQRLEAERVSIGVVVTELWPTRVRQALQTGGVLECTFAAYVDVFRTGWRVEREIHWSPAFAEGAAEIIVKLQGMKPRVESGALGVNASYLLEAGLAPGSALGAFLRSVPVVVRAEIGYIEEKEGALHGRIAMDVELQVKPEGDTGRTVVALPFSTMTSASLPSLVRQALLAGASLPAAGGAEHVLVFAAAPGARATASLLGATHSVGWSRNFSVTERSESERRLGGRRLLPALHEISLLHRFRIDEEVLEVLVAVAGNDPTEATLRVRRATALSGAAFEDLLSLTVRTDKLLEPAMSLGKEFKSDLGNISSSTERGAEVTRWSGAPDMNASLTRRGEDFSISLVLPGNMKGELALAGGAVTGSLASSGTSLGSVNGTVQKAVGSEDQTFGGTLTVGSEPMSFTLTFKPAQRLGGALVGSLANSNNKTETLDVDAKLEVADSGDVSSHLLLKSSKSATAAVDLKLSVDVTEPSCGRILATLDIEGRRELSADTGCTRSAASADFVAHAILNTNDTQPALVNASVDFDSYATYGGMLTAFAHAGGQPLLNMTGAAWQGAESRTLGLNLTMGSEGGVNGLSVQHTLPDAADLSINGSLVVGGAVVGKGSVWGNALDRVLATQTVEGRRELVLTSPGVWNASVSVAGEGGNLTEAATLGASLAQAGSVLTLDVAVPQLLATTLVADSSSAGSVLLNTTVRALPSGATQASLGGRMTHSGDMSGGTLTLVAGDVSEALDLSVSRGFLLGWDSTYKFNLSLAANVSSLGMVVDVDDAYVKTFEDWSFAGGGWDLALRNKEGQEQLLQGVDLGMAAVAPASAKRVVGSMKVEVQGDVAAFVADPLVKRGFQQAIAETVGVPASVVKVTLRATRRLSEWRRLAGAVTVDYEIALPAGKDAATVASAISAKSTTEMAVAVNAAVKAASGGASEYSITVTESSAPQIKDPEVVEKGSTDGACAAKASALLAVAAVGAMRAM